MLFINTVFKNNITLIPLWDLIILLQMRVISKRTLREFWLSSPQHEDSKAQLEAWHSETIKAHWTSAQDIKEQFRSASILKNNRVVFNIAGNKYRLIVAIDYKREAYFIKFIGTHKQYEQINAETV